MRTERRAGGPAGRWLPWSCREEDRDGGEVSFFPFKTGKIPQQWLPLGKVFIVAGIVRFFRQRQISGNWAAAGCWIQFINLTSEYFKVFFKLFLQLH